MQWRRAVRIIAVLAAACVGAAGEANAARPLLDQHQWDRNFALFARYNDVPWKPTQVRLETYSSAPVEMSAFAVQPEDVISAGNARGRPLDVRGRKPVANWRFSPPSGYRVEGNDVTVPLGAREGVFVISARRGNAVQQVWINRSRIGLLVKAAPRGITMYGCDLGDGRPLAHLRVLLLVNRTLVTRYTDGDGLLRWDGPGHPSFVLAEWGESRAFLTLPPQAPLPPTIVSLRVDQAVVRSGDVLNVAGFARRLHGTAYERAGGTADIRVASGPHSVASAHVRLDDAGAFVASLHMPSNLPAGSATVLADVNGASAGTALRIEATGDLDLSLDSPCAKGCRGLRTVPITVLAQRQGRPAPGVNLAVSVLRYPHIVAPGEDLASSAAWGATEVLKTTGRSDARGTFTILVPESTDGLPSTFGITARAEGGQATASTRLDMPNSSAAVTIVPERAQVDVGREIAVGVHAFHSDTGTPLNGSVRLRLTHGPNSQMQTVGLDGQGHGRAVFTHPEMGTNLITASVSGPAGDARDANSVLVAPRTLSGQVASELHAVVHTDAVRYRPPSGVGVYASTPGAVGAALLSIDAAAPGRGQVVRISRGSARAGLRLVNEQGDVRASVAYVHDGAVITGSTPLLVDGPGRQRHIELRTQNSKLVVEGSARVTVDEGRSSGEATTVVRLTDGVPSAGAIFDTIGEVLATGGVTTLVSAGDDPPWHAWVTPSHSAAADLLADLGRRQAEEPAPTLDASAARVVYWHVERGGPTLTVPLPHTAGQYFLSILRIYTNGDVGGASTMLNVVGS
jgi:hypothetical protein